MKYKTPSIAIPPYRSIAERVEEDWPVRPQTPKKVKYLGYTFETNLDRETALKNLKQSVRIQRASGMVRPNYMQNRWQMVKPMLKGVFTVESIANNWSGRSLPEWSRRQILQYLSKLLKKGLLERVKVEQRKSLRISHYRLTDKGHAK